MNTRPTEADFLRVAKLIGFDRPLQEIHDLLIADGLSEEEFFLCYKAGGRQAAQQVTCDHGVPQVLHIKMTMTFFRPDTERCPDCRAAEEAQAEREEARLDGFLARLAARRAAEGR